MKKMGKVARLASLLVLTLLFGLFPIESGNNLNKVQAVTPLNNPRTVTDSSMNAKQKVTWDCVWFGAYPQSEVTSGDIYNKLNNFYWRNYEKTKREGIIRRKGFERFHFESRFIFESSSRCGIDERSRRGICRRI